MSELTPNLGLFKRDPATEGNQYFNIQEQINDPLDVIDAKVGGQIVADDPVPISLVPGPQIVDSPRVSRVRNVGMSGRTLVNLLGRDGNCESIAFSLTGPGAAVISSTQKKSGLNSIKFTSTGGNISCYKDYAYKLDASKSFVLSAWVFLESYTSGAPSLSLRDSGLQTIRYQTAIDTNIIGSWQFVYVKIPTNNTLVGNGFRLLFGNNASSGDIVSYWDDIRLYELSAADYDAIGTTYATDEQIDAFLPYVDDMKHVEAVRITNPGKNLLPPFSEVVVVSGAVNLISPYSMEFTATASSQGAYFPVPVCPNTDYSISVESLTGKYAITDDAGNILSGLNYATSPRTFNAGSLTKIRVYFSNETLGTGTFTFTNPMLNIGTEALPFVPQQPSHLYLWDMHLASNVDRSVRDELYMDDEGKPRVTRRFREIALDGSLAWTFSLDYTGYKRVYIPITDSLNNYLYGTVLKYSGIPLRPHAVDSWGAADEYNLANDSRLYISVSDTDSGWGESYTPSADEIKMYFNGFKMYLSGSADTVPYNGTGTKAWVKRNPDGSTVAGSGGSVYTVNSVNEYWTYPYRLMYQLAQSVDEAVSYEGELMLHDGQNQVEVGTGIVVREAVMPAYDSSNAVYRINYTPLPASQTKLRTGKIIDIYKDDSVDNGWTIQSGLSGNTWGYDRASTTPANYDPTAAYSVTYEALDKYLIGLAPLSISVNVVPNIKEAVDDLTRGLTEAKAQFSVLVNTKAQKQQPGWIAVTLLNGWVNFDANHNVGYFKSDDGIVRLRGAVKSGTMTNNTILFIFPSGYRPSQISNFVSYNSDTTVYAPSEVYVLSDGRVGIKGVTYNGFIPLEGIQFRAEQ